MLKFTLILLCSAQIAAYSDRSETKENDESRKQPEKVLVERRLSDLTVVEVASIYGLLNKPRIFEFDLVKGESVESTPDPERITRLRSTQPLLSSRSFRNLHDSLLRNVLRDDERGMVSGDGQYSGLNFALSSDLQQAMLVVRTKASDKGTEYIRLYHFSVERKELFILDSALVGRTGITRGDFCHDGSALLYDWNETLYLFDTRTKARIELPYEGTILPVTNGAGFLLYQKSGHTFIVLDKNGVELVRYKTSQVTMPSTAYSISQYSFVIGTVVEGISMKDMVPFSYVSDEMYLVEMIEQTETYFGTASVYPVVISVTFKD